jgi:protein involved in polysaccharide export with SLBB domain
MKKLFYFCRCLFGAFFLLSFTAVSQISAPTTQQIEQFKNLPRPQQEALARQMGFDISLLDQVNANGANGQSQEDNQDVDFVSREVDNEAISKELAKQSIVEDASAELKPFGYEIFESREDAITPSNNVPVPSNYIVGPGDSVKLQLFGKESGQYELSVTNEGNIDLPDLGPLKVAGTNFQELKDLVKQKYDQQKIGVTAFVSMGQVRTIQIFLVGEVYRPGPLVVSGMSTLTSALINSGGVNEIGSLRTIELKRGGNTVAYFDLYDLIVRGDTSGDVRLEQGDVLFVPTARNIVSIEGQVRRPAIYELLKNETVGDLLSLAGGLLPTADASSLQLVRSDVQKGLTIANVDMASSESLNKKMMNGDFLRVPKANLEFSNAIIVSGAINLPNIIADTGLKLSDTVTEQTLLTNTDLHYALLLRKQRFDNKTTVVQFKPLDVLTGKFDLGLQAFDELLFFNRVAQDVVEEVADDEESQKIAANVVEGDLKAAQDDLKTEEAKFLQDAETNRFKTDSFNRRDSSQLSRKALLASVISRLKSEASEKHSLQLFEVTGQVKYPGVYPLPVGISMQKVINAAGGLTESAHLENAEVTRLQVDNGVSNVEHMRVNLLNQLAMPESQQFALKSKDVLNIVRIPQWFENNNIELKGEVVFPGVYQISEGETLSSVIERAGGLTSKASSRAAVFSREELKQKESENIEKAIVDLKQQLANSNLSNSQFTRAVDYQNASEILDDLTDVEPLGRMVIDLEAIVNGMESADIELKNGDVLSIPNITPAVSIIGEVFVSTTYRFDAKLSVDDYISLAGGVREYGDASKLYIVKANGSVVVPESDFWFSETTEQVLEPGDTIVVPRDVTNYDNISLWQGITQIVYQTAVALAAIGSL